MNKILVIGAGGFIGSHLCEEILNVHPDWEITAVDITTTKIQHLLGKPNFNFLKINILSEVNAVDELVKTHDIVLPLAAVANPSIYVQDPLRVFALDFEANLQIVKSAAKHHTRVVFPSTSEVYGMCGDEEFVEDSSNCVTGPICKQRWIYSCCKQMLDRIIYALGVQDKNFDYTLFRPFNWIGPRLDDISNPANGSSRVVTQFLSNILHGQNIQLVGGGAQIRCFTYISDGISALIKILENENGCASKQIFNIGNPSNELSIKDLASKIKKIAMNYSSIKENAKNIEIISVDPDDYYGESYQDVSRRVPSIMNSSELLGWEPKVGLDELLTKTMDFYFN